MYRAVIATLLLCGACKAELAGGDRVDAAIPPGDVTVSSVDSAVPADAPPDARACEGGDARMTAPDGSCVVLFSTPQTWTDAQAACTQLSARLLVIADAQTDTVARTLAGTRDVFIGLTDTMTENTFVWVDGTAATYTNWRTGEPNDGNGNFPEDCGIINGVRGGQWDDRPCGPVPNTTVTGEYPYLCQY